MTFAKAVISIPGGLKVVVYTDVLQTIILFFGFLGVASLGGWKITSLILVLVASVIADPGRRLTMYGRAQKARLNGAWWLLVYW